MVYISGNLNQQQESLTTHTHIVYTQNVLERPRGICGVSSTGGGVGEASPPKSLASPPNNFKHSNIMHIFKIVHT